MSEVGIKKKMEISTLAATASASKIVKNKFQVNSCSIPYEKVGITKKLDYNVGQA